MATVGKAWTRVRTGLALETWESSARVCAQEQETCLPPPTPFIPSRDQRIGVLGFYLDFGDGGEDGNVSAPAADSSFFNALFDPALLDRLLRKCGWGRKTSVLVNMITVQSNMHSLIANKLSEYRSPFLSKKSWIPICLASGCLVFKLQNTALVSGNVMYNLVPGKPNRMLILSKIHDVRTGVCQTHVSYNSEKYQWLCLKQEWFTSLKYVYILDVKF